MTTPEGYREAVNAASTDPPGRQRRVGLILLGGLLFLRLPFLAGLAWFLSPLPDWVMTVFELGTYALSAALIWWERRRLADFHLGIGALALFLAAPFLERAVHLTLAITLSIRGFPSSFRWVEAALAGALFIALFAARPALPRARLRTLLWAALGVAAGLAQGTLAGYLLRFQEAQPPPSGSPPAFVFALSYQLTHAAVYEEPLFRGFLWGYLRRAGWRELWIWLFQAALFWLGHVYYLRDAPYSFWIIVPLSGLVLGLLAWGSRRTVPGMLAHALTNCGRILAAFFGV